MKKKSLFLFLPLVFFACVASTCCEGLDGSFANAVMQKDSLASLVNLPSVTRTMVVKASKSGMELTFNEKECNCVDVDEAMTDAFAKVFAQQGDLLATTPELNGNNAATGSPISFVGIGDPGWTSTGGVVGPTPPRPKKDPDLIIGVGRMAKVITGVGMPPVLISVHKYADAGATSFNALQDGYSNSFRGEGPGGRPFFSVEKSGYMTVAQDLGDGQNFVRIGSFDRERVGLALQSLQIQ
ncbi:MAG: hypothetical protein ACKVTZ_13815 [Bacteroidia bacterium]